MNNMKNVKIGIIALIVGLLIGTIVSISLYFTMRSDYTELQNLYISANDTLVVTRNELGQEISRTSVLEAESGKLILKLQTKDEDIIRLQSIIRREQSINTELHNAIYLVNGILANYKDSLNNTISGYQSIIDSLGNIVKYPIYDRKIDMFQDWITGDIRLGYSVFDISLKTRSAYEIITGRERKNIFHKYKSYAKVTNLNPYDHTEVLKVYSKTEIKPSRFNVSVFVGYGFGVKSSVFIVTPMLGIGLGYKLFSF